MGVKLDLSYILRDVPRLRVFENRVLRRVFGPKRVEGEGSWRRLHNEKHHNSYVHQILLG
jgi:hypothetical protein